MSLPIQPLPTEVVHQIAAAEVIDSLAAVVRELVENALDAQATRLSISLWPELGRVRVADDGWGMNQADLRAAALPHSTSKIQTQSDLWQIESLGFRGQALNSLSQVAELDICSRPRQAAAHGWRIRYSSDGTPEQEETVAIAPGTIVTVSHLFSQWPARLQALPNLAQQLKAVQRCLQQLALCHPTVTFQVHLKDQPWLTLPGAVTARDRLAQILKPLDAADLRELTRSVAVPVAASDAGGGGDESDLSALGDLYLLMGLPDRCHRRRPDWINVAVNGRLVSLPELEQTLIRAFRFTLPRDRFPVCFVHLKTRPNTIDWNRHPDKSTIYLHFIEHWKQAILQAVQETLQLNIESLSQTGQQQRVQKLLKTAEPSGQYASLPGPTDAALPSPPVAAPTNLRVIAQVQNRYILAERSSGICLIEQHIAHERVLYEHLAQQWSLVPLSPPVILDQLSPAQVENLQLLQLDLTPFGSDLWAVRTVPAPLAQRSDVADALREISLSAEFDKTLVAIACRTAIRNGTPLSLETMQQLVSDWQQTCNPHTCPHGRPICLALEETSLARFFKRHWVIGKSHGLES